MLKEIAEQISININYEVARKITTKYSPKWKGYDIICRTTENLKKKAGK
jgi:hypothetical protein